MLTEGRITCDHGSSDPESRHLIGDDFFGVRQGERQLSAQSNQQRAEILRSLSYVGVVIGKHGQRRLPLACVQGNPLSFGQSDDGIKLIGRRSEMIESCLQSVDGGR